MINNSEKILVGVTRDFMNPEGTIDFVKEIWEVLREDPRIDLEIMEDPAPTNITGEHTCRFDAIMMKRSPLRSEALAPDNLRLRLISRNGVGYDHLDVDACTQAGVMISITPDAVRRPVALSLIHI